MNEHADFGRPPSTGESPSRATPIVMRPRILVADDDGQMRSLLAATLRRHGYGVTTCSNGVNLLQQLGHYFRAHGDDEFDLVITDIRMPGLTGIEVLEGLRGVDGHPPVILITAFGDAETHAAAHRLGAAAIFDKPFELDGFVTAVQRIVELGRAENGRRSLARGVSAAAVVSRLLGLSTSEHRARAERLFLARWIPEPGWKATVWKRCRHGSLQGWWRELYETDSGTRILVPERGGYRGLFGRVVYVRGQIGAIESKRIVLERVVLDESSQPDA
jgi:CheY-like chemotaxis protein